MTWEELVVKAKELGYDIECDNYSDCRSLWKDDIFFDIDGDIYFYVNYDEPRNIAYKRTPAQMYQIMKALKD